jgi:magnesium-protoporphyrin O-methyltransferase
VVGIDLSPTLVNLARERLPAELAGQIDLRSGDMLDASLGHFDHVVAMDSIIHYETEDAVSALATLAQRTSGSIVFTFAPRTPMLAAMISIGRLFPRGDRAPWLEPMAEEKITRLMAKDASLEAWQCGRTQRVSSGFYKSQAMEWTRQ